MINPYEPPRSTVAPTSDGYIETVECTERAAKIVADFFAAEGYRLESGGPKAGVYGVGNKLLWVMLGDFVSCYRFQVTVHKDGSGSTVRVEKGMSSAFGGPIAYWRMTKELRRIRAGIEAAFR